MTTWLLEDSTDPEQMLDGEVEQDKRHWFVGDVVVLDHSVICTQLKLFFVHNFLVRTIWHTKGGVDITPEKTSELIESLDLSVFVGIKMFEDHIELGSEWSSGSVLDGVEHPKSIIVVDEAITKDSCDLMCPKSKNLVTSLKLLLGCPSHTTNDFGEISQVECVMCLQRSWFQISLDLLINLHCACNDFLLESSDIWREVSASEMPFEDRYEDGGHGVVIEVCESNNVEMSLESWCNETSSTTWSTHSCDNHRINDVSEWMLVILSIVPSTLINELPQDLNWWLSAISLLLWHVEIIDEDDASHTESWTVVIFSPLIEFHIDNVLDVIAVGLGRESDFNNEPFVSWELSGQDILDVGCLTSSCGSNKE